MRREGCAMGMARESRCSFGNVGCQRRCKHSGLQSERESVRTYLHDLVYTVFHVARQLFRDFVWTAVVRGGEQDWLGFVPQAIRGIYYRV